MTSKGVTELLHENAKAILQLQENVYQKKKSKIYQKVPRRKLTNRGILDAGAWSPRGVTDLVTVHCPAISVIVTLSRHIPHNDRYGGTIDKICCSCTKMSHLHENVALERKCPTGKNFSLDELCKNRALFTGKETYVNGKRPKYITLTGNVCFSRSRHRQDMLHLHENF